MCDQCRGAGEIVDPANRCETCKGDKTVPEEKIITLEIEKGMEFEQAISFYGEADENPDMPAGNLIFVLKEKRTGPEIFARHGDDLIYEHTLSLGEALTGFSFVLKHLDDKYELFPFLVAHLFSEYVISHKDHEIITPETIRVVKGLGMPIRESAGKFGDLLIKFNIKFPEKLTAKDREALLKVFPFKDEASKKKLPIHHTVPYQRFVTPLCISLLIFI